MALERSVCETFIAVCVGLERCARSGSNSAALALALPRAARLSC
jgi:hypothetical protein